VEKRQISSCTILAHNSFVPLLSVLLYLFPPSSCLGLDAGPCWGLLVRNSLLTLATAVQGSSARHDHLQKLFSRGLPRLSSKLFPECGEFHGSCWCCRRGIPRRDLIVTITITAGRRVVSSLRNVLHPSRGILVWEREKSLAQTIVARVLVHLQGFLGSRGPFTAAAVVALRISTIRAFRLCQQPVAGIIFRRSWRRA